MGSCWHWGRRGRWQSDKVIHPCASPPNTQPYPELGSPLLFSKLCCSAHHLQVKKKMLTKQRLLVIFIGLLVISIVIFYWEHFHKSWDKEINPLLHHKFQNVFFSVPICKIPALGGSRQFFPTTNILILGQFSPPKAALFLINNISVSSLLVVVLHDIIKSYLFSTRKWCHWHEYKYFKVKFVSFCAIDVKVWALNIYTRHWFEGVQEG